MKEWHLDPREITWGTSTRWRDTDEFDIVILPDEKHSAPPCGPGYRSSLKQSRNFKKTTFSIVMTHILTGVEVHGRFVGYYSREEEKAMKDQLGANLFKALEKKVAKYLKVSGR